MTRGSHSMWAVALGGTWLVACGARTGLLAEGDVAELSGDGGACVGPDIPIELDAPNLYFVLDHSSSMMQESKWDNVRQVVAALISDLGATARFGAAMFPTVTVDACATGTEVMSLRQGDTQGATASTFLSATNVAPSGGTPTAATLEALRPTLSVFRGSTFVILATDGGPNCNDSLSCDLTQCTINIDGAPNCTRQGPTNCCAVGGSSGIGCLDESGAVKAVSALTSVGIQTFIVGIPGSAPYGPVLDQMASAGGTARPSEPLYYRVDSADTNALESVLQVIAAKTGAGCSFALTRTPAGERAIRVLAGGAPVAPDLADGWSLDGATLSLHGRSCGTARTQGAGAIRVVACGGR